MINGDIIERTLERGKTMKIPLFSKSKEPYERRYIIYGKVQRVGYRKWLKKQAEKEKINGWVRNRSDGTVEAVLSAMDKKAVIALEKKLQEGPPKALVENIEKKKPKKEVKEGFEIKKTKKISPKNG